MYIYDRPLTALPFLRNEQAVILQPSQVYDCPHKPACVREWYGFGQGVSSSVPHNQPGQPLSPQADYVIAQEVMDAVGILLSRQVSGSHLARLASNANPLMIERGLIIYRYDDGRLRVGDVSFGTMGSRTSEGTTRYSVKLEYHTFTDAGSGQVAYPWLYIHTHPAVQKFPGVPSGIHPDNGTFVGDLYVLRNEPTRQIGIMTIGVNAVIKNFQSDTQEIPFTLAIRDPIKGPTDYRPTRTLDSHKAASTALRLMFKGKTVSDYYTDDLRTKKTKPFISASQERK